MKTVLLLNNIIKSCGVQQWGMRLAGIVKLSSKYNFVYKEVGSHGDYYSAITKINPDVVLYNYHVDLMPWLTRSSIYKQCKNIAIVHEGFSHKNDFVGFDCYIYVPKTDISTDDIGKVFNISRPLLKYDGEYPINEVVNIGSFGFGFKHKRFPLIVETVNNQYDNAVININMPFQFKADPHGKLAKEEEAICRSKITKPGIRLNVTNDFLSDDDLLSFLAKNDINAFFYDSSKLDSSSGATDFALSVDRPIALTLSPMFKHITDVVGESICIENNTFDSIIKQGTGVLSPIKDKWSNDRLLSDIEEILANVQ